MKNLMKLFVGLIAFLFVFVLFPALVYAQDAAGTIDISNPGQYFTSISTLAGLVIIITSMFNKLFETSSKALKQIISWLIAILLSFIGWALKLGMFISLEWYMVVVYGFATGLLANGIFDIAFIKTILTFLKIAQKK